VWQSRMNNSEKTGVAIKNEQSRENSICVVFFTSGLKTLYNCIYRQSVQFSYMFVYYALSLKIQSRGMGWNPINLLNCTTFLCLSQARTWISNITCPVLFLIFGINKILLNMTFRTTF
jgi:hypothetical protein